MAENRRVKATKKTIRSAYLGLLGEKGTGKISVTEVCSVAKVNRSTFYAHYKDIDALHREMEDEVISHVPSLEAEGTQGYLQRNRELLEDFFQYICENGEMFRVLLVGREKDDFEKALVDIVFAQYRPDVEEYDDLESRYAFMFCVSGVIGALSDWVRHDFPVDPKTFAGIIHEACRKVVSRG